MLEAMAQEADILYIANWSLSAQSPKLSKRRR